MLKPFTGLLSASYHIAYECSLLSWLKDYFMWCWFVFYSQQLLLHWRQTVNQNVYLGLVNVIVSPRVCSMLPGENCDVKIPTQLTESHIDRLPRPHCKEGQRQRLIMVTQEQLWLPNSCHLDLVTQACISARWRGYSNWHRLGLPFQISRESYHGVRRNIKT